MVFNFNLENINSNIDCLWLLSKESIETGLLDQEIDRRYTVEKVYEYINQNKEKWINEILANSKLQKDAINSVISKAIIDKTTILNKLHSEQVVNECKEPSEMDLKPITENFTGKAISCFWFKGEIYEVKSWKELLIKLCNILYNKHTNDFEKLFEIKGKKRIYFTHDKSQLIEPMQIPDTDIYVETNHSAMMITWICCKILSKFGYSNEDLKVGAKEKDKSKN